MQRLIKGNDFGFNNADGTLGNRDKRTVLGSSSRRCARRGRRLCCRYHKRTSLAGFIPCARKRIKQIGAKVKRNQSVPPPIIIIETAQIVALDNETGNSDKVCRKSHSSATIFATIAAKRPKGPNPTVSKIILF